MALLDARSQVDKAMADTLVRKAEGDQFDSLASMYGLPRVPGIPVKYWRQAVLQANVAKRDSLGVIFRLLREALRGGDQTFDVQVDSASDKRHRIYWVSGPTAFSQSDVFRLWEIEGKVYWSIAVDVGVGFLELTPFTSPLWAACDWSQSSPGVPSGTWTEKTATLLPFVYRGYNAQVELYTFDLYPAPPTFLQDDLTWTMDVTGFGADAGDLSTAFLYDGPDATLSNLTITEGTGAAGIVVDGVNSSGVVVGPEDGLITGVVADRGGSFTVTLWIEGVPTALTATLGATEPQVRDTTHSVNILNGDAVFIQIEHAVGTTRGLSHPIIQVEVNPPAGEPAGGNMADDATSDDPTTGPWPIYLNDPTDADWQSMLNRLVAMGIVVRAKKVLELSGV